MIQGRCLECRLIWHEDRGPGDSPIHPEMFCCPRCKTPTDMNQPLYNPIAVWIDPPLFSSDGLRIIKGGQADA